MEITEIKVTMHRSRNVRAFVDIVLDDCFIVRGLKIIEGAQGHFVAMPSRKTKTGKIVDMVHPIQNETRILIENAVLDEYEAELNK